MSRWYDPGTGEYVSPPWREQLVNPEGENGPGSSSDAPSDDASAAVAGAATATAPRSESTGPGSKAALLAHMRESLSITRMYVAEYGNEVDLVISGLSGDALEEIGLPHVEYAAALRADESKKTAYMWESLKESSGGLAFGGVETDLHTPEDVIETIEETGGLIPDEESEPDIGEPGFDYRSTRDTLSGIASAHGWEVEVSLSREDVFEGS